MAKLIVNKESIIVPKGTIENFNRPNHPDFMVSSELKKEGFSGIRHNSLTDEAEIWLDGEIKATVSRAEVAFDPDALNKAFEKVFALEDVMPDHALAKASRGETK